MFKRYWIIAVVLGLIAVSLQAQEQTQSRQDRAENQQKSTENLPLGFPIRIIEDDEAAKTRERRETISYENQNRDIVAQEDMAKATKEMNDATQSMKNSSWASAILVAIGTFLLIWTLCLTRQANESARVAVEVTERIGQAQVRAYLGVDGIGLLTQNRENIGIGVTNYGNSPSLDLMAKGEVIIPKINFLDSVVFRFEGAEFGNSFVAPNSKGGIQAEFSDKGILSKWFDEVFSDESIDKFNFEDCGTINIFYKDVFGERWEVECGIDVEYSRAHYCNLCELRLLIRNGKLIRHGKLEKSIKRKSES